MTASVARRFRRGALRRRGALLIFGGVYGNWEALEAACAVGREEQIPPSNFVITGDLPAYCADGARVVRYCRVALADAIIIRGNVERSLAEDAEDCQCGFAADSACRKLSVAWYAHARATIAAADKKWMGVLPRRADILFGGRRLAVMHAAAESDNQFIFPSTADADKAAQLNALAADGVICGHSGIPFSEQLADNRLWHNSGALGMPANDGTPRTWLSIWQETADGIRIRHRPLSYATDKTAEAMRRAGLPDDYRKTLSTGIWPSDDILPNAEKQKQGEPLHPADFIWQRD